MPTETPAPEQPQPTKRLSATEVARTLLDHRGSGGTKTTAATIGRSARGVVTWELTATGEDEAPSRLAAAVDALVAQHLRLAGLFPLDEGEVG